MLPFIAHEHNKPRKIREGNCIGNRFDSIPETIPGDLQEDSSDEIQGIRIQAAPGRLAFAKERFIEHLNRLGLADYVVVNRDNDPAAIGFSLRPSLAKQWAPDWDTTQLCRHLDLDTEHNRDDLEREILLAMLLCPVPFDFPSYDELTSAVRVRMNIVTAARKTSLAFDTESAERPEDYWTYSEENGFTIRPGKRDPARHRPGTRCLQPAAARQGATPVGAQSDQIG